MSKYTQYDAKNNVLYISTDAISPKAAGMSWKEWRKAWAECFEKTYPERIEEYASPVAKRYILHDIEAHPGCRLSEFIAPHCGL